MNYVRGLCAALALLLSVQAPVLAQEVMLRVAAWNLEGNGDIDPDLLESQLAAKEGVDIWGLSEVRPNLFEQFRRGAAETEGADFEIIRGSTGNDIRLAVVFDTSAVELLNSFELDEPEFRFHRAPLVAEFRGKRTGQKFLFAVNHLARGNASARLEQAKFLNGWLSDQALPVILVGDMNMDFHVSNGDFGDRDEAYDALVADDRCEWLRPRVLVKTQSSPNFNTVLDFIFLANVAPLQEAGWTGAGRILQRAADEIATEPLFNDDGSNTDHRPVDAIFSIRSEPVPQPDGERSGAIAALLERLQQLEEEIADIRATLAELVE